MIRALLCITIAALAACGQKGPLKLPEPPAGKQPAAQPPAAQQPPPPQAPSTP